MEQVTSRNNPLIRRFREVARASRIGSTVLLDGPHLLEEALRSRIELQVVAFTESAAARHAPLVQRCRQAAARIITVPDTLGEAISPVRTASGIVALASLAPSTLESVIAAESPQLIVVLESVQDPGNVGAVIRTSEACGGTGVIIGPGSADPLGWKALRGSMGSALRLPIAVSQNLHDAVKALRAAGIRTFAAVPRNGSAPYRAKLHGPSAILLGGEGAGLEAALIEAADETVTIEMRPPVESLNVAVAAALMLYEASRQRADVTVR